MDETLIRIDNVSSVPTVIIGDKGKDIIIQTRGRIKIMYGNKLVDLFDFGSLNQNSASYTKSEVDEIIDNLRKEILK